MVMNRSGWWWQKWWMGAGRAGSCVGVDLGDERLNKRAVKLLGQLGEKPSLSIPAACGGWAETQAAYRFFGNEKVGWEGVLEAHGEATLERVRSQAVVLAVQDTTELDFEGKKDMATNLRRDSFLTI